MGEWKRRFFFCWYGKLGAVCCICMYTWPYIYNPYNVQSMVGSSPNHSAYIKASNIYIYIYIVLLFADIWFYCPSTSIKTKWILLRLLLNYFSGWLMLANPGDGYCDWVGKRQAAKTHTHTLHHSYDLYYRTYIRTRDRVREDKKNEERI